MGGWGLGAWGLGAGGGETGGLGGTGGWGWGAGARGNWALGAGTLGNWALGAGAGKLGGGALEGWGAGKLGLGNRGREIGDGNPGAESGRGIRRREIRAREIRGREIRRRESGGGKSGRREIRRREIRRREIRRREIRGRDPPAGNPTGGNPGGGKSRGRKSGDGNRGRASGPHPPGAGFRGRDSGGGIPGAGFRGPAPGAALLAPAGQGARRPPSEHSMPGFLFSVSTVLFPPILHLATASHMRQPTAVCASRVCPSRIPAKKQDRPLARFFVSADGTDGLWRSPGMRLGRCGAKGKDRPLPFAPAPPPLAIPKTLDGVRRAPPSPSPFTSPLPPLPARSPRPTETKQPAPCSWGGRVKRAKGAGRRHCRPAPAQESKPLGIPFSGNASVFPHLPVPQNAAGGRPLLLGRPPSTRTVAHSDRNAAHPPPARGAGVRLLRANGTVSRHCRRRGGAWRGWRGWRSGRILPGVGWNP